MTTTHEPGQKLLREVRANFVSQGVSLGQWCREQGIHFSNARQVLLGTWNGPAGRKLRDRIIRASRKAAA